MKKSTIKDVAIVLCLCLSSGIFGMKGDVWIMHEYSVLFSDRAFSSSIHVDSGNDRLISFNWHIAYTTGKLDFLDYWRGIDGYLSAQGLEPSDGLIPMAGFDVSGSGPSSSLRMIIINWNASRDQGYVSFGMNQGSIINSEYAAIKDPPRFLPSDLILVDPDTLYGDMDGDGSITILDALLVAQYSVGLYQTLVFPFQGDVNFDQKLDILDALLIAMRSVGTIQEFPYEKNLNKRNVEMLSLNSSRPVNISPWSESKLAIVMRDVLGEPVGGKTVYLNCYWSFFPESKVTGEDGVIHLPLPVIPWDGDVDYYSTLEMTFEGDEEYAPATEYIDLRFYSPGMTVTPTPDPLEPTPTPVSTGLEPYFIRSANLSYERGRDGENYVTLDTYLPSPCYMLLGYEELKREGNLFVLDTDSHYQTTSICSQASMDVTRTYSLGDLERGIYEVRFLNWGKIIETLFFAIP